MMKTDGKIWTPAFTELFVSNLLTAMAFYFLIATLPVYFTNCIHTNGLQTGVLLASYSVAAIIVRPFTGYFIDVYGRKWIFLVSVLIVALLINLYNWLFSFFLIFLLRFAHGLTWGVSGTTASTIAVDILPEKKRGQGIGLYGLSMTLAMAIGPLIGLFIVNHLNYHWLFTVAFLLCFLGVILAFLIKFPSYTGNKHRKLRFKNLFAKKSLHLSVCMFLLVVPYGGIVSFIVLYANQLHILNPGYFFMIYAAGVGISRLLSGRVFDSKGPDGINIFAILMNIAGFLLLSIGGNETGFFASAFVIGISNGIIFPVFQTMVTSIVPQDRRGTAISTLFTAFDLGVGAGMVLTGFISDRIGLKAAYLFSAAISLAGLIYYFFVAGKQYRTDLAEFSSLNNHQQV